MTDHRSPFESSSFETRDASKRSETQLEASGAIVGIDDSPAVFRGDADLAPDTDPEDSNLAIQKLSRTARDHFISAAESIKSGNMEEAETHLYSCRDCIEDIWPHVRVRSQPFHDLLALVEVGVKSRDVADFEEAHLDVLRTAFTKLCKPFLDYEDIEESIESCAEYGLDLATPLKQKGDELFRIIIEPMKKAQPSS